jgi:hypothetical protein
MSRDRGKRTQKRPDTEPVAPISRANVAKTATQALTRELESIEYRLRVAHATCVTAHLALRTRDGEDAPHVALALEWGAGETLSVECRRLNTVIVHLLRGAPLPGPRCPP